MKYNMNNEARIELKYYQYKRMLEERRGHNFEYWNDEKHEKMLKNGWFLFEYPCSGKRNWNIHCEKYAITSEYYAKKYLKQLRESGNFARIICGYTKTIQREKHFSIIYKPK